MEIPTQNFHLAFTVVCGEGILFTYQGCLPWQILRVNPGQRVERKQPFFPPLHSWYLIGLVPASHQGPAHGVPAGRGGQGVSVCAATVGMEWGLASKPEPAVSNKTLSTSLPFPLSSFGFSDL